MAKLSERLLALVEMSASLSSVSWWATALVVESADRRAALLEEGLAFPKVTALARNLDEMWATAMGTQTLA
jgi:hypothetical protein